MDALAGADFGYVTFALMGNNPAPEALEFIALKYGRIYAPFIVIPDNDDQAFGAKLVTAFAQHGVASRVSLLAGAKDICELTRNQREKFFSNLKG